MLKKTKTELLELKLKQIKTENIQIKSNLKMLTKTLTVFQWGSGKSYSTGLFFVGHDFQWTNKIISPMSH